MIPNFKIEGKWTDGVNRLRAYSRIPKCNSVPGTVVFVGLHDVVDWNEPKGILQLVCDFIHREEESANNNNGHSMLDVYFDILPNGEIEASILWRMRHDS